MKIPIDQLKSHLRPQFPIIKTSAQHPHRVGVWFVIIALWAINWGSSTVSSVLSIFNPDRTQRTMDDWQTAIVYSSENLFEGFCVVVLTVVLIKYYAGVSYVDSGLARQSPRPRYAQAWTVATYLLVISGSQYLANELGKVIPALDSPWYVNASPQLETPQAVLESMTRSISAGSEEILFTVGIITLLYAAGYKPWVAWTAAIVLRTSFHLHYFPDMLWVPVWAAATVYIYQRFGCVWTMLAVHILIDIKIDLDNISPETGTALATVLIFVYFVIVGIQLAREQKNPQPEDSPVS